MVLLGSWSRLLLRRHAYSIFQSYSINRLINDVNNLRHVNQGQKRTFFKGSKRPQSIEYNKKQIVGFSMDQMFDVISDVDNYCKFIPLCTKSVVTNRSLDYVNANLVIGYPPVKDSFTANVTFLKPNVVKAECFDGKFFQHMLSLWRFSPGIKPDEKTCIVDFQMTMKFDSALQSRLITIFFDQFTRQMEGAFMKEVEKRYGPATMQAQKLLKDPGIKE